MVTGKQERLWPYSQTEVDGFGRCLMAVEPYGGCSLKLGICTNNMTLTRIHNQNNISGFVLKNNDFFASL